MLELLQCRQRLAPSTWRDNQTWSASLQKVPAGLKPDWSLPHAERSLPLAEWSLPLAEWSLPLAEWSLKPERSRPHPEWTLPHLPC